MIKKVWSDPVWSKVIATAILTAIAAISSYFLHWWPSVGAFFRRVLDFALSTTPTPNWLLGLLGLLALPLLLLIIVGTWQHVRGSSAGTSSWGEYTEATFFDIRWRWKYDHEGDICYLNSFCPRCDFQIFPKNASAFRAVDHIAYACDSCGASLGDFPESYESLESKVRRLIQQKLRQKLRESATPDKKRPKARA